MNINLDQEIELITLEEMCDILSIGKNRAYDMLKKERSKELQNRKSMEDIKKGHRSVYNRKGKVIAYIIQKALRTVIILRAFHQVHNRLFVLEPVKKIL